MSISETAVSSDWKESVQGLQQLEEFYALWKSSNQKIETVWTSFRLLPLNSAYLIASHYSYDQFGWSLKTKWNLFTQFDKALHNGEAPHKIASSIVSALETQRKIVALEKVIATLKDRTKTSLDKVCAYQVLKTEDAKLYQDVLHKIWVAKGKSSQQKETEVEISQQPDGPYSKGVVEKMLDLYKDGFPVLGDSFFEKIIRE